MKKILLVLAAALAATIPGLNAGESSFETMLANPPQNVSGAPAVSAPSAVAPAGTQTAAPREWLVLVFINGVNDLGILGYADKSINAMEKVGSTDSMAVVVKYGKIGQDGSEERNVDFQRGSRTLYITRDTDEKKITSQVIPGATDSDMGSAASLARFVKSGIRKFPAKKTAVILWNHGAGQLGISYDDVSRNHMEVDQLGAALGQIAQALGRKIDVFATDACYMQMAAVAYELKDSAAVIVGSEEVAPLGGFPYDTLLGRLAANPGTDAEGLGRSIVDTYGARYKDGVTLSAIRTSAMGGFVEKLDSWVNAVSADQQAFKVAASKEVVGSAYTFLTSDSKDLYDYIKTVNGALKASPAAKSAGAALQNYIARSLVIRATVQPSMGRTHGLAIYIPELRYNSGNYEKLAFAADSQWDDFLRKMMEERLNSR
ncbi:MAG: clostripain-related cysteine peptidase [Elusimicrobia bacterium]|nr:clostripain-related cysteine peptidase [Elusimicrobiota bacterium]